MTFEKIFVLGAGAIGSVYGAFLSKKNDVTLIGNRTHVNSIQSNGLSISDSKNEIFHVKARTEIVKIPENTLIIVTTKANDSLAAIQKVRKLLKKDTVILLIQNGLGNKEAIRNTVDNRTKVLRGITKMAAEFFESGKIRFWSGNTIIEHDETAEIIAETLNRCELETKLSKDMRREIWDKVVVNCIVNPLTSIFRVRNNEIITDSLKAVRDEIFKECVEVGEAEGIVFSTSLREKVRKEMTSYSNFSSMCQDIMKGKRTEIDFLNGRIVELGRKHGVSTPVNETMTCLIKFVEEKNGISKGN